MSAAILNFIYFHFPRILFTNPLAAGACYRHIESFIRNSLVIPFSFSRHRFGIVVWSLSAWWLCVQYEYSMIQRGKNGLPDQTSKTKQLLNCTATPSVGSHRKLLTTVDFFTKQSISRNFKAWFICWSFCYLLIVVFNIFH